ncbi:MAG: ABC transporter ATP-binding protein [Chloroflexi bacterium]|nr:ABC transporter ATP-binding protein [Chloroflexota bacterium]
MQSPAAPPRTAVAAEAVDVTFSYENRQALNGLSLSVAAGSIFGLLGPNGSGKTTLLSLFAGLRAPDSGSVTVLGETPSTGLRARIGFVFQESTLDPLMTVREVLAFHGKLFGMTGARARQRLDEALETVALTDRANDAVRTLSGGMRRRLELARAFLPSPELLLLDEPTAGLDPDSEKAVWAYLHERNEEGVTIIAATNKVSEADRHADAVAFVHDGRIVAQGAPPELKSGLKHDGLFVEGEFSDDEISEIKAWPEVGALRWSSPLLHLTVDSAATFVPKLFQAAGASVSAVRVHEASLEDAYFDVVGSGLDGDER